MTEKRMTEEELAEEARRWDEREVTPAGWEDAPEAVPRAKESVSISIRLPRPMVEILKEFARRAGIGYQVLMKRWLDERIRQERERFRQEQERLRREREDRPSTIKVTTQTSDEFQGITLKLVRIEWEGPLSLAEVIQRDGTEDYGLYMIEGHNLLYGCKGGLYFGVACDQTYATRMKQHEGWLKWEQDVTIRLGRLRMEDYKNEPPDWADWCQLVADIEALTIYWHAFPYNSRHIWSYSGQPLRVQNWGSRGNLQTEYSSDWMPPRPSAEFAESGCS